MPRAVAKKSAAPAAAAPAATPATKTTKKSKKTSTFKKSYIRNIGKQVAPGLSFSSKSTNVLSDLAVDFYSQLIKEQNQLVTFNKNSTLTGRHAQTAFKLVATGELLKHGISEATKAVNQYKSFKPSGEGQVMWKTKCGLSVDPVWCRKMVKKSTNANRISKENCIVSAACVEYMLAEIIELAANANTKSKLIKPKHIQMAISNDEELYRMFGKSQVSTGGVVSNIHPNLMKAKMSRNQGQWQNAC